MLQTTNYNLKKPQLTDSPPDITVMNPNWDAIDAELNSHEEQINSLAADAAAHKSEVISHTQRVIRDLSLIGYQHVTLPFKAKSIVVNAYLYPTKSMSWGQYAENGQQQLMKIQFDGLSNSTIGNVVSILSSSGSEANGTIVNITDSGFDINWSKTGNPTGSCDLFILAQTH